MNSEELPRALFAPTLYTGMQAVILTHGAQKTGDLARMVLARNNLKRAHISTKEFELLKERIKRGAKNSEDFSTRKEIIDKNNHLIISLKTCSE